ncbi:MAG: hypothetical protein HeimC3_46490, partial [Candidatus Heimdallarchaeota archaeon LC_3]
MKLTDWKHLRGIREINLGNHLTILQAPNFIGKTSVLEALEFALTGELPNYKTKKSSFWIAQNSNLSTVELYFSDELSSYVVKRTLLLKKKKTDITSTLFEMNDDGSTVEVESGDEEVNNRLSVLFNLNTKLINQIIFMNEQIVTEISKAGKNLLGALKEVLIIPKFKDYRIKLVEAKFNYEKEAEKYQKMLNKQEKDTVENRDKEEEKELVLRTLELNVKNVKNELNKAEKEKKIIETKFMMKKRLDELNEIQKNIETEFQVGNKKEFEELEKLYENNLKQLRDNEKEILGEKNILLGQRKTLARISDLLKDTEGNVTECPVCQKPLDDDEHKELLKNSNNNVQLIDEKIEKQKTKENEIHQKITNADNKISNYRNKRRNYDKNSFEIKDILEKGVEEKDYRDLYNKAKENLKTADSRLKEAEKEYKELLQSILSLKRVSSLFDPDLPQKLTETWHKFHIANLTVESFEKSENEFIDSMLQNIGT